MELAREYNSLGRGNLAIMCVGGAEGALESWPVLHSSAWRPTILPPGHSMARELARLLDCLSLLFCHSRSSTCRRRMDTKGPEVRSGDVAEPLQLAPGDNVVFTIQEGADGKDNRISGAAGPWLLRAASRLARAVTAPRWGTFRKSGAAGARCADLLGLRPALAPCARCLWALLHLAPAHFLARLFAGCAQPCSPSRCGPACPTAPQQPTPPKHSPPTPPTPSEL